MMIFRPGSTVRLLDDAPVREMEAKYPDAPQTRSTRRIKTGAEGTLIATRPLIDQKVLVKFPGCLYQLSMDRKYLEVIKESI